jgi:hypothetical protein
VPTSADLIKIDAATFADHTELVALPQHTTMPKSYYVEQANRARELIQALANKTKPSWANRREGT